jgi:glycosyltransferase involved in cell wall biosynthesis
LKILYTDFKENLFNASAGGNRTLSLLNELSQLGVQIVFYSHTDKVSNSKAIIGSNQNYSNRSFNRLLSIIKAWWHVFFSKYQHINVLEKIVVEEKPDIIWMKSETKLFRFLINNSIGKTVPLYLEQSEFLDLHRTQKSHVIRRWQLDREQRFIEEKLLCKLSGLGLMTKTLFKHYSEGFGLGIPLLHIPMTVDLKRFDNDNVPKPKEFKQPYIAYVGVMNNIKDGINLLIQAFARISIDFSNHTLYLVGPWQPDTPGHLRQIETLGMQGRIEWMKTYSRELIPAIMTNAELLVLPRPDSKQAQGGFPTKLGEYLATGKPVCATTVGEIPEYLEDEVSVYFAQPGSVGSFEQAMQRALKSPQQSAVVGLKGRKVAEEKFNASIQARKLKNYFEELLESHSKL